MAEQTIHKNDNQQTSAASGRQAGESEGQRGLYATDFRPSAMIQRRMAAMVQQAVIPPVSYPAVAGKTSLLRQNNVIQRVKYKKGDSNDIKVKAWMGESAEPSHPEKFIKWCASQKEIDDWVEVDSYTNWKIIQAEAPDEHDSGRQAAIIERVNARRERETAREEKKTMAPAKAASAEDEMLRIRLAEEEAAEKRRADAKAERRTRWARLNLSGVPAAAAGNAVTNQAWLAIEGEYINRINPNLSIGPAQDRTTLETALAHWRGIPTGGDVTYISRFTEIQDKSQRAGGGTNTTNLDTRAYQANFIATVDSYQVNVHLDMR